MFAKCKILGCGGKDKEHVGHIRRQKMSGASLTIVNKGKLSGASLPRKCTEDVRGIAAALETDQKAS